MKTLAGIITIAAFVVFFDGCGENAKGPEKQITPPSAANASVQEAPPPDQVAVDKEPTLLKKVEPVYPELAKKAGLEGKVWVKILVDTEGKPKQVVILKSDSDVFNQVAVDAANQFLFTPAYLKDKPVSVWVSVPFKFKLADKVSKPGSPEEASFMKGYIAAKEEGLSTLQKDEAAARASGKPDPALQQKIQKAKAEIQVLRDALRAMEGAK
jgi:TonB family protein